MEYKYLSEYLTLSDITNNYKTNKKELEVEEALNEVSNYLRQITNIDSNYLTRIKKRDDLAFKNNLPYYEKLNKEISKISEDSNYYYSTGIFDEKQLSVIHNIQIDIERIIFYSNENNLDTMFEFKKIFITNILKNLNLFNIKKSDKIICYSKEKLDK